MSETETDEDLDREPNGVSGGEEESQEASGSSVAGRRTDEQSPRLMKGQEHCREGQSSKHLNLEGHILVLL